MKALLAADNHFDERSERWAECLRVHDWIAEMVGSEGVDLVLLGGDLFERLSTPRERRAAARWMVSVADHCPVLGVLGNHDPTPDDVSLFGDLRSRHPIVIVEDARVVDVQTASGPVSVACVAWPSRAGALDEGAAREALRSTLAGLGAELATRPGVRLALGHFDISGAVNGSDQPLIGSSLTVSLADLGLLGAQAVLCGHIHRPQAWEFSGTPVIYAGSPYRTDFGEPEAKSVVLVEADPTSLRWRRVDTTARPMVALEGEWEPEGPGWAWTGLDPDEAIVEGSDVRLRYHVGAEHQADARREAARLRARIVERGATTCKVEGIVDVVTRVRHESVVAAVTIAEQLRAFWRSRGDQLSEAHEQRLLGRLAELDLEPVP